MDGTRFDALTKLVARGASRRSLLKAVIAGVTGGALARKWTKPELAAAFELTPHGAATVGGIALGIQQVYRDRAIEAGLPTPTQDPPVVSAETLKAIIGCLSPTACRDASFTSYVEFDERTKVDAIVSQAWASAIQSNTTLDTIELIGYQLRARYNPYILSGGNFNADAYQNRSDYHFDALETPEGFVEDWASGILTNFEAAVTVCEPQAGKPWHLINRFRALQQMGFAFHAIQDFYAHSNWVEKQLNRFSSSGNRNSSPLPIADLTSGLWNDRRLIPRDQFVGVFSGYFNLADSPAEWEGDSIRYLKGRAIGCPRNQSGYVCVETPDTWTSNQNSPRIGEPCSPVFIEPCNGGVCSDVGFDPPQGYRYCHYNINKDSLEKPQGRKHGPNGDTTTLFEYAFDLAMQSSKELVIALRKRLVKQYQNSFVNGDCIFDKLFYDTNENCCREPLYSPSGRQGRGWAGVTQCILPSGQVTQEYTVELEGEEPGKVFGIFLDQDKEQLGDDISHKPAGDFTIGPDGKGRFTGCLPVAQAARVVDIEVLNLDDYLRGIVGAHQYILQSATPCECARPYTGVCADGKMH